MVEYNQGYHIQSLLLRFVLILQCYALQNYAVFISKKCYYL